MPRQRHVREVLRVLERAERSPVKRLSNRQIAQRGCMHHTTAKTVLEDLAEDNWATFHPAPRRPLSSAKVPDLWSLGPEAPPADSIPDERDDPDSPRVMLSEVLGRIRTDPEAAARILRHAHRHDALKATTTALGAARALLGVDSSLLSKWEHGGARPPLSAPLLLALALEFEELREAQVSP